MKKKLVTLIILILIIALALVYFSRIHSFQTPKEVHFKSGRFRLYGQLYLPSHPNGSGIVFCHGANSRGCRNILYLEMAKRFAKLGYVCLLFDYRGYGLSEGPKKVTSFEDLNFTQDAISAVSFLKKQQTGLKHIIIIGHSMGGGVAVSAGVRDHRIDEIVSISPGRRVEELFLAKDARLGMKWIQHRMYKDMTTKVKIPLDLLRKITLPIVVDSYRDFVFMKPTLFVEGVYEKPKDIDFLTKYVIDLKNLTRKEHILLGSGHWFGTASGTRVVFPIAIHNLVVTIDALIRNDEDALKDILRRDKNSERISVR